MKHLSVEGVHGTVVAERVGDWIWIHHQGETFAVPAVEARKKRGHHADEAEGDIAAPMPGKVTQIFVKAGDRVSKGQVVFVMEAMKMEYNLKSGVDGSVGAVNAKIGEQVTLGSVLVHIKPEGAS